MRHRQSKGERRAPNGHAGALVASIVAAVAALVVGFPATGDAATSVVDVTGRSKIVTESIAAAGPADPNRCVVDFLLEFPDIPGAVSYSAQILNSGYNPPVQQGFVAVPPNFPYDSYTRTLYGQTKTFTAPSGFHRIYLAGFSSGSGCAGDPWVSIVSVTATATTENQPPTAAFTAKARSLAPLTVDFDGSSSTDDKGVVSYAWKFGDGGIGTGAKPSHPFAGGGIYPVTLTVTDAEGLTDTHTEDISVAACAPASVAPAGPAFSILAVRQATFRIHVVNSSGGGVRNVRVEAKDECTGRAVLAPATDRDGRATATLTIDGPTSVVLKGMPDGHVGDPVVENFDASADAVTRDVELRTPERCLDRPVTVLGTDQGEELGLYPGDVVSALGGQDTITAISQGDDPAGRVVCGGDHPDTVDLVFTGDRPDQVDGGDGTDTIGTGGGDDRLIGGADPDRLIAGRGNDEVYGGDGNDTLTGGAGCDAISGGEGDDVIDGEGDADGPVALGGCALGGLDGGPGNDHLKGGPGNDLLAGAGGCDALEGEGGADQLIGGADPDAPADQGGCTVDGLDGGLYGGPDSDTLAGDTGSDKLSGNGGDDRLTGDSGNDILEGGGGSDWLSGGADADRLDGAAGCDHVAGDGGDDTIKGGPDNDAPSSMGGCAEGLLDGGVGIDTIDGEAGRDLILGGSDCDRLVGGIGDDTLDGGEGDDRPVADVSSPCNFAGIEGGVGEDLLYGGAGRDQLNGSFDDDEIWGDSGYGGTAPSSEGADIIYGGPGADRVFGGNESLPGCSEGDQIVGDAGADTIFGGDGGDAIFGGPGGDTIHGNGGCDDIFGEEGGDHVFGDENSAGMEILWGGEGDDTVSGGPGRDAVYGGAGLDVLGGDDGDDVLDGGVTGIKTPLGGGIPADEPLSRAQPDEVDGGVGRDRCAEGRGDQLVNCEDDDPRETNVRPNERWPEFTVRWAPRQA
jgi:Ca2+-binding RTX toxin-like protein